MTDYLTGAVATQTVDVGADTKNLYWLKCQTLTVTDGAEIGTVTVSSYNVTTINATDINATDTITTENLVVTGTQTIANEVIEDLTVTGNSDLNNVTVSGTATINTSNVQTETVQTLTVLGNEIVDGNLTVDGILTAAGSLNFTNLTVDNLDVTGTATIASLSFSSATIPNLTVTGNETVNGTLGVTGTTTLGTADITTLSVSGNGTVTGTLGVTGITTLGTVNATTLGVTGTGTIATLDSTNATITNALTVHNGGNTALATVDNLDVPGTATIGTLTFSSATVPNLTVTGTATINDLVVTGTLTYTNLTVSGTATIENASIYQETVGISTDAIENAAVIQSFILADGWMLMPPQGSNATISGAVAPMPTIMANNDIQTISIDATSALYVDASGFAHLHTLPVPGLPASVTDPLPPNAVTAPLHANTGRQVKLFIRALPSAAVEGMVLGPTAVGSIPFLAASEANDLYVYNPTNLVVVPGDILTLEYINQERFTAANGVWKVMSLVRAKTFIPPLTTAPRTIASIDFTTGGGMPQFWTVGNYGFSIHPDDNFAYGIGYSYDMSINYVPDLNYVITKGDEIFWSFSFQLITEAPATGTLGVKLLFCFCNDANGGPAPDLTPHRKLSTALTGGLITNYPGSAQCIGSGIVAVPEQSTAGVPFWVTPYHKAGSISGFIKGIGILVETTGVTAFDTTYTLSTTGRARLICY